MSGDQGRLYTPVLTVPRESTILNDKFGSLMRKFYKEFNCEAEVCVRVPGRVNLIGEHVDYCGYSVCPMAIQYDIQVAASVCKDPCFLELKNVDSINYPDVKLQDDSFIIDLNSQGWASYFLCGLKGVMEKLNHKYSGGIKVLVSGNIPPGSGLSSSSALVCAAFLTLCHLYGVKLPKEELATLCAICEQYVGTVGGGMDQAIAILGSKGCAKHIEFSPLRTQDVILPENASFVIAHSCVIKNKAASSDFNIRVVECRLTSMLLAKRNYLNWRKLLRFADVQKALNVSLDDLIVTVEETFHNQPYTKQEICEELKVSNDELNEISLTPNTANVQEFKLKQRALHVLQEARRVSDWCLGCKNGADIESLGRLMNQSHNSLRDLYQCSHSKLDKLVQICLDSGAAGARLTGAGWGGCVVALTAKNNVSSFIASVKEKFYGNSTENLEALIFATGPNQGAEIYVPE